MSATVIVNDIQLEPQLGNKTKACVSIAVESEDSDLDFSLTFRLPDQPGMIESTLEEGRFRLIALFEDTLASLRRGPLRRN